MDVDGPRRGRRLARVVLTAYAAWGVWYIWRWSTKDLFGGRHAVLFEDAMITMRYARNLAAGHGPVWNVGEHVEGFSNPLMLGVMALVHVVFPDGWAPAAIQVLGLATMVAIGWMGGRIAMRLGAAGETARTRAVLPVAGTVGALAFYLLGEWTLLGMETGLFALAVLAFWWAGLGAPSGKRTVGLATAGAAMTLSRPEGLAVTVLALAWLAWHDRLLARHAAPGGPSTRAQRFARMGWLARLALPSVAAYAGMLAFRWAYFGSLLPNTYTLKMAGIPWMERVANGIAYSVPQLLLVWPAFLPFAVLRTSRRAGLAFGPLAFLAFLAVQVWVGGDFLQRWRMVAPAMPALLVACAVALVELAAWLQDRMPAATGWRHAGTAALLTFVAVAAPMNAGYFPEAIVSEESPHVQMHKSWAQLAAVADEILAPDATVAVFAAGIIPYETGRPSVDILGKADTHVAGEEPRYGELPPAAELRFAGMRYWTGHNKSNVTHSIGQAQPDFAQILDWFSDELPSELRHRYELTCVDGLRFYLLRDSPKVDWQRLKELKELHPCD